MISIQNKPTNHHASDVDFTVECYQELIHLALASYPVADYRTVPWGHRFIIWRHDCDYSLNRSLALAMIEAEMGLKSTYFLNPHSEFYNFLEQGQLELVRRISDLGHDIGLHFDGAFYRTGSEERLNEEIAQEADLLERFVGIHPAVFSFHNPTDFHLTCEAESYGGLVNCYSKRFKTEVAYCSDSNGYWRFRRLFDVLSEAKNDCLQVLTHPGWWQEMPAPPRQRIFHCAYGRAAATMEFYDRSLAEGGRGNLTGNSHAIQFLKQIDPAVFDLCDYLWNAGQYQPLFLELWRIHETQITRLCKAKLYEEWGVPVREMNLFFADEGSEVEGRRIFTGVFGDILESACGDSEAAHHSRIIIRDQLLRGRTSPDATQLEEACVAFCEAIQAMATWGLTQVRPCDGLAEFSTTGLFYDKSAGGGLSDGSAQIPAFQEAKWKAFTRQMLDTGGHPNEVSSK